MLLMLDDHFPENHYFDDYWQYLERACEVADNSSERDNFEEHKNTQASAPSESIRHDEVVPDVSQSENEVIISPELRSMQESNLWFMQKPKKPSKHPKVIKKKRRKKKKGDKDQMCDCSCKCSVF